MPAPVTPLLDLDLLLTDAERATADRVAALATGWRASIADWFASGDAPVRGIALDLGSAGLLGMSLPEPFGTAAGAVAYGMACMEVEAVDSGLRSLLSVQGSLAMHAIHAFGSPEQAERWLPGMAAGAIVGGFAASKFRLARKAVTAAMMISSTATISMPAQTGSPRATRT